jgi:O-antigen biosynthesis protein WbqP
MAKRLFDLFFVMFFLGILSIPLILVCLILKLSSRDSVFYFSRRVGRHNKIFMMPKFRTMKKGTPDVATHLLKNPRLQITRIGFFLRKYSIDEWPQLWSIFVGDMSFVGPRPALFNQYYLISLRSKFAVDKLTPGLTGLAQVNGRDELTIGQKVKFDVMYLQNKSLCLDFKILYLTFIGIFMGNNILH